MRAMRDFKEPYYEGPDCVCCKDKLDAMRVLSILVKERSGWAKGTLVATVIDSLISKIFK